MIGVTNCGRHRAGDGSYHLKDINRIPVKRCCDLCRATVDPSGKLEADKDRQEVIDRYRWLLHFEVLR